jgi:hypothetical protein
MRRASPGSSASPVGSGEGGPRYHYFRFKLNLTARNKHVRSRPNVAASSRGFMCGAAGANSLSMALLPSRATSSRPRSPPHELSPPPPCSISLSSRSISSSHPSSSAPCSTYCVTSRREAKDYNNPCSSSQCCTRKNVNRFPLEKTICIIVHALQVYFN